MVVSDSGVELSNAKTGVSAELREEGEGKELLDVNSNMQVEPKKSGGLVCIDSTKRSALSDTEKNPEEKKVAGG